MKAVEIDCGENVTEVRRSDVELGDQLYLAAGDGRIEPQFARDGYKVFLQNLIGNDSALGAAMLGDEFNGPALLGGRGFVVRIDQNVSVKETTGAHGFRCD